MGGNRWKWCTGAKFFYLWRLNFGMGGQKLEGDRGVRRGGACLHAARDRDEFSFYGAHDREFSFCCGARGCLPS
jgi:hypothetical protein